MKEIKKHLWKDRFCHAELVSASLETLKRVQGDNRQGRGEVRRVRVEMNSTPTRVQHVLPHGGQLKKAVAKHNFHIKYERTNTYELVSGHNCLNPF